MNEYRTELGETWGRIMEIPIFKKQVKIIWKQIVYQKWLDLLIWSIFDCLKAAITVKRIATPYYIGEANCCRHAFFLHTKIILLAWIFTLFVLVTSHIPAHYTKSRLLHLGAPDLIYPLSRARFAKSWQKERYCGKVLVATKVPVPEFTLYLQTDFFKFMITLSLLVTYRCSTYTQ